MLDLRSRRISNEWEFAVALVQDNPEVLDDLKREHDDFWLRLSATPALVQTMNGLAVKQLHEVRFEFPRYYPAAPIEAYVSKPVLHPNVHPENGFVCLWDRHSAGDTMIEAVSQLRSVLTWKLVNLSADHLMQPEIAERFSKNDLSIQPPFSHRELVKPAVWLDLRKVSRPGSRPRLSLPGERDTSSG